ncbi:hypothetical protein CYLTODRAFT_410266 [Cylindrobasidium torrendii FP15055 ss-10]|uniref:F-box domain-containing protein n=1 Tax=Cylindrobasidium torrendii FP15055 ss-10 TaxID=1314674 RepID=A0A0D7BDN4_9AGAR|nr:hypothetical protein CYLTODRAFT_410266 [Cylindrobasidium torrendii FP15055 ss-10]
MSLPVELIVEILDLTVSLYKQPAAPLALICRTLKPFVDEILYRNVIVARPSQLPALADVIARDASKASHVRSLILPFTFPVAKSPELDALSTITNSCPGLTHLSCPAALCTTAFCGRLSALKSLTINVQNGTYPSYVPPSVVEMTFYDTSVLLQSRWPWNLALSRACAENLRRVTLYASVPKGAKESAKGANKFLTSTLLSVLPEQVQLAVVISNHALEEGARLVSCRDACAPRLAVFACSVIEDLNGHGSVSLEAESKAADMTGRHAVVSHLWRRPGVHQEMWAAAQNVMQAEVDAAAAKA